MSISLKNTVEKAIIYTILAPKKEGEILRDGQNRNIDYLRLSITDRCNLRCQYCMPEKGIKWLDASEILHYNEMIRLCAILANMGLRKIKVTGGEPLVRSNVHDLIRELYRIPHIEEVTLTTNGLLLAPQLDQLYTAGLRSVNISIDTLNIEHYKNLTRGGDLSAVLDSIAYCLKHQMQIKINCVMMAEQIDDMLEIACLAKESPIDARFIEMMPIGIGSKFSGLAQEDLLQRLEAQFGSTTTINEKRGNGPAHYVTFPDFQGCIGFIDAISHQFCDQCNRIRLTANGYLKMCLQHEQGVDLKTILRSNASDDTIRTYIEEALQAKPKQHTFKTQNDDQDSRCMFQIGG